MLSGCGSQEESQLSSEALTRPVAQDFSDRKVDIFPLTVEDINQYYPDVSDSENAALKVLEVAENTILNNETIIKELISKVP